MTHSTDADGTADVAESNHWNNVTDRYVELLPFVSAVMACASRGESLESHPASEK